MSDWDSDSDDDHLTLCVDQPRPPQNKGLSAIAGKTGQGNDAPPDDVLHEHSDAGRDNEARDKEDDAGNKRAKDKEPQAVGQVLPGVLGSNQTPAAGLPLNSSTSRTGTDASLASKTNTSKSPRGSPSETMPNLTEASDNGLGLRPSPSHEQNNMPSATQSSNPVPASSQAASSLTQITKSRAAARRDSSDNDKTISNERQAHRSTLQNGREGSSVEVGSPSEGTTENAVGQETSQTSDYTMVLSKQLKSLSEEVLERMGQKKTLSVCLESNSGSSSSSSSSSRVQKLRAYTKKDDYYRSEVDYDEQEIQKNSSESVSTEELMIQNTKYAFLAAFALVESPLRIKAVKRARKGLLKVIKITFEKKPLRNTGPASRKRPAPSLSSEASTRKRMKSAENSTSRTEESHRTNDDAPSLDVDLDCIDLVSSGDEEESEEEKKEEKEEEKEEEHNNDSGTRVDSAITDSVVRSPRHDEIVGTNKSGDNNHHNDDAVSDKSSPDLPQLDHVSPEDEADTSITAAEDEADTSIIAANESDVESENAAKDHNVVSSKDESSQPLLSSSPEKGPGKEQVTHSSSSSEDTLQNICSPATTNAASKHSVGTEAGVSKPVANLTSTSHFGESFSGKHPSNPTFGIGRSKYGGKQFRKLFKEVLANKDDAGSSAQSKTLAEQKQASLRRTTISRDYSASNDKARNRSRVRILKANAVREEKRQEEDEMRNEDMASLSNRIQEDDFSATQDTLTSSQDSLVSSQDDYSDDGNDDGRNPEKEGPITKHLSYQSSPKKNQNIEKPDSKFSTDHSAIHHNESDPDDHDDDISQMQTQGMDDDDDNEDNEAGIIPELNCEKLGIRESKSNALESIAENLMKTNQQSIISCRKRDGKKDRSSEHGAEHNEIDKKQSNEEARKESSRGIVANSKITADKEYRKEEESPIVMHQEQPATEDCQIYKVATNQVSNPSHLEIPKREIPSEATRLNVDESSRSTPKIITTGHANQERDDVPSQRIAPQHEHMNDLVQLKLQERSSQTKLESPGQDPQIQPTVKLQPLHQQLQTGNEGLYSATGESQGVLKRLNKICQILGESASKLPAYMNSEILENFAKLVNENMDRAQNLGEISVKNAIDLVLSSLKPQIEKDSISGLCKLILEARALSDKIEDKSVSSIVKRKLWAEDISHYKNRIAALEKTVSTLQAQPDSQKREATHEELKIVEAQLRQTKEKLKNAQTELNMRPTQHHVTKLRQKFEKAAQLSAKVQAELKKELEQHREKLSTCETQLEAAQKAASLHANTELNLKRELEECRSKISDFDVERKAAQKLESELVKTKSNFENELQQYREKLSKLEAEREAERKEFDCKINELTHCKNELQPTLEKLKGIQNELTKSQKELSEREEELRKANATIDSMKSQLSLPPVNTNRDPSRSRSRSRRYETDSRRSHSSEKSKRSDDRDYRNKRHRRDEDYQHRSTRNEYEQRRFSDKNDNYDDRGQNRPYKHRYHSERSHARSGYFPPSADLQNPSRPSNEPISDHRRSQSGFSNNRMPYEPGAPQPQFKS